MTRQPPMVRQLRDGRLHLQDGPIDLIVEAFGASLEIDRAYAAAARRFITVLDELCSELPLLRARAHLLGPRPQGAVAVRMWTAVAPFAATSFITPMAAVAGAVAEEILEAMTGAADLRRAYVNNGGDIALWVASGEVFEIGIIDRPDHPGMFGTFRIGAEHPVRGIATSGWRGRSFSLGIADAVTILADRASAADAAATLVANAVDLPGHPAVQRQRADERDPMSDLGARLVTIDVGSLSASEIDTALAAGCRVAEEFLARGVIRAAALHLGGRTRQVETLPAARGVLAAE